MKCTKIAVLAMAGWLVAQATANAQMRITEWMYQGAGGGNEFIEFTNIGGASINMAGWSFDDDSEDPGTVSLSAFGVVAAGESVILSEASATDFRTAWNLSAAVKVIGGNATNLGRNDQINLYDNNDDLMDVLTYGDQDFPGTIRTQNVSGNPLTLGALGADDPAQWVLSSPGDAYGSYGSTLGDGGNPGVFSLYEAPVTVPEPASLVLLVLGASVIGLRRRGK